MINLLTQESSPQTVMEWFYATLVPLAYEVAQRTGLLRELTDNSVHSDLLAERLGLSKRGVRCILNCLVGAGIVAKADDGYYQIAQEVPEIFHKVTNMVEALAHAIDDGVFDQVAEDGILPSSAPQELSLLGITEVVGSQQVLTAPGRHYFTPGQDSYLGVYFLRVWQARIDVINLVEVVKTGRPILQDKKNSSYFVTIAKTLFPLGYDSAQQLADHLASFEDVNRVLDLGAGSAVWSIPLAQRKPHLRVDAFDLPQVLDVTRTFTQRYGVQRQYSFLSSDFMASERWGEGFYDLIYVGYICCGFSIAENQSLLTRCAGNLRPGGYLVLIDHLPKSDRTGPLLDVLFSIRMLLSTNDGDTYTPANYETWCRNAGLDELKWRSVSTLNVPLLIARKTTK